MWLGMSINAAVRLSTQTTANIMGLSDTLGTLKVGAEADIALLQSEEGKFIFTDTMERSVTSDIKLSHVKTIKAGRVYHPWLRQVFDHG